MKGRTQVVSLTELANDPTQYHGKRVVVQGTVAASEQQGSWANVLFPMHLMSGVLSDGSAKFGFFYGGRIRRSGIEKPVRESQSESKGVVLEGTVYKLLAAGIIVGGKDRYELRVEKAHLQ